MLTSNMKCANIKQ